MKVEFTLGGGFGGGVFTEVFDYEDDTVETKINDDLELWVKENLWTGWREL